MQREAGAVVAVAVEIAGHAHGLEQVPVPIEHLQPEVAAVAPEARAVLLDLVHDHVDLLDALGRHGPEDDVAWIARADLAVVDELEVAAQAVEVELVVVAQVLGLDATPVGIHEEDGEAEHHEGVRLRLVDHRGAGGVRPLEDGVHAAQVGVLADVVEQRLPLLHVEVEGALEGLGAVGVGVVGQEPRGVPRDPALGQDLTEVVGVAQRVGGVAQHGVVDVADVEDAAVGADVEAVIDQEVLPCDRDPVVGHGVVGLHGSQEVVAAAAGGDKPAPVPGQLGRAACVTAHGHRRRREGANPAPVVYLDLLADLGDVGPDLLHLARRGWRAQQGERREQGAVLCHRSATPPERQTHYSWWMSASTTARRVPLLG